MLYPLSYEGRAESGYPAGGPCLADADPTPPSVPATGVPTAAHPPGSVRQPNVQQPNTRQPQ